MLLRFFALFFFCGTALAYIPPGEMIFNRTTANQGNRGYIVVIEARLNGDAENLVFRETWTVRDDQGMNVRIEGITPLTRGFRREYIYKDNNRYWLNQNSEVMYADLGPHHFERYLHFRDGERFRSYLLRQKIIPQIDTSNEGMGTPEKIAGSPSTDSSDAKFPYKPEPYVRLSRWNGKIAYTFGVPTPASGDPLLPGLWIEQDNFHILRVRSPQQAEMVASDYHDAWGLAFPKNREIKWKGNTVNLTMVSISKATIGPKTRRSLEPASLKESDFGMKNEMADTLNTSIMNEFYQRFR